MATLPQSPENRPSLTSLPAAGAPSLESKSMPSNISVFPRGRENWFDRNKGLIEGGMLVAAVCASILAAIKVVGDSEQVKADDLANFNATSTAIALENQEHIQRRIAYATQFAATPEATQAPIENQAPIATSTPVETVKPTATVQPSPTEAPKPTATEEPLDRYPDVIQKGELPKQLKTFTSAEQAIEASKEQGKPINPLVFLNPASVEMKKTGGGVSSVYKVTSSDPTLFLSTGNSNIIDSTTYHKIIEDYANLKKTGQLPKSLIVITTKRDVELLPPPPAGYTLYESVKNVEFLDGDNGITRREVGMSYPETSDIELFKQAGDKANPLEPILQFKGSAPDPKNSKDPDPANTFRFYITEFTDRGGSSTTASFDSFAQVDSRAGYLPLTSVK